MMTPSGLFSSWAMPGASRPMAASFSTCARRCRACWSARAASVTSNCHLTRLSGRTDAKKPPPETRGRFIAAELMDLDGAAEFAQQGADGRSEDDQPSDSYDSNEGDDQTVFD